MAVAVGPVAPLLVLGSMPSAWAQNTFPASGNVGIGTMTPAAKLHVVGDAIVEGNLGAKYQDVAEWLPRKDSNLQPSDSQPLGHIELRFEGSFRRWGVNSNDRLRDSQHFEPWHGHLAVACEANSHQMHDSVTSPGRPSPGRRPPGPCPPW